MSSYSFITSVHVLPKFMVVCFQLVFSKQQLQRVGCSDKSTVNSGYMRTYTARTDMHGNRLWVIIVLKILYIQSKHN